MQLLLSLGGAFEDGSWLAAAHVASLLDPDRPLLALRSQIEQGIETLKTIRLLRLPIRPLYTSWQSLVVIDKKNNCGSASLS